MKQKILIIILFSTMIISCKKEWLDQKPSQDIAQPTTLKDFQAMLNNDILTSGLPTGIEIASDVYYCTDATLQSNSEDARNAYTWSVLEPYGNAFWSLCYTRMYYCNLVLDGLKKIDPSTAEERTLYNNIKGQALFIRAFYYYYMSQMFVPPYNPNEANLKYGMSLRLEADVNKKTVRSSIQETYDQIIGDLTAAKDLLPGIAKYKTWASKASAWALLARTYLAMSNYSEALNNASLCLNEYNFLLDYNTLAASDPYPVKLLNNEVIFHATMTNVTVLGSGLLIDPALFAQYDINDLRRSIFFKMNTGGTIGFKGSYNGTITNFCGIAIDEIYLIRAECLARQDKISESMSVLNTLLKKRWKNTVSYIDITANTQDEALSKIIAERKKELLLRGIRWTDMRRLMNDTRFAATPSRSYMGKTYFLNEKFRYTFPIPNGIMEFAVGENQNPGW